MVAIIRSWDIPSELLSLWQPQFNQLNVHLEHHGSALACTAKNSSCICSAWVMPISNSCAIIDHDVVPARDLDFYEAPLSPYACLCTCSVASVRIMPDCGINQPAVRPTPGPWPSDSIYSFTYTDAREARAVLRGGQRYRSRSICMLPGFFSDLEKRYPNEGFDLMDSFNGAWGDESATAIRTALRRLGTRNMLAPGAHLFAQGTVETLIAQLAEDRAARDSAELHASGITSAHLAEETSALIEGALNEQHAPGLEELAEKLYVSRSTLCAVFKQETGESLGAYIQRRRIERAKDLLADGLAPTQVAHTVGYSSPSSFSQAFRKSTGYPPSTFRQLLQK